LISGRYLGLTYKDTWMLHLKKCIQYTRYSIKLNKSYKFDVVLNVHRWYYVEIKCQLDATDEFLLQISWGLCVRFAETGHTTLNSTLYRQLENQAPNTTDSNHLYNALELLMMGIKVPETRWASNKICNKKTSVASSWHFISTNKCLLNFLTLDSVMSNLIRAENQFSI
jgi:hypothetical protein